MSDEKFIEIRVYIDDGRIETVETNYTSVYHHGYSTEGFYFVRNTPDRAKTDFKKMLQTNIRFETNKIKDSKKKIAHYKEILENFDIYLQGADK